MAKSFRAYFKTEDDMLSAHASLKTLHTQEVTIDKIPDAQEESFIPFVATNTTTSNMGYAAVYQEGRENNSEMYVLEGKVGENEYSKAMNILKRNKGYQRVEEVD